jgi:hypothetical protein
VAQLLILTAPLARVLQPTKTRTTADLDGSDTLLQSAVLVAQKPAACPFSASLHTLLHADSYLAANS